MHAIISTITLALSVGIVSCAPATTTSTLCTTTTVTPTTTAPAATSPVRDSYGCLEGSLTTVNNQTFVELCNADYPFNDIIAFTAASYTACVAQCAGYNGCTAVVWNKGNHNCYLKEAAAGWYYQPVADAALLLDYNFNTQ